MLQYWKGALPPTCEPIYIVKKVNDAFNTTRFALGTAASWQIFHMCNILLLTSGLGQVCPSGGEIEVPQPTSLPNTIKELHRQPKPQYEELTFHAS
jgi:hypothetical protein